MIDSARKLNTASNMEVYLSKYVHVVPDTTCLVTRDCDTRDAYLDLSNTHIVVAIMILTCSFVVKYLFPCLLEVICTISESDHE